MMRTRKLLAIAAVVAAATFGLAACSSAAPATAPSAAGNARGYGGGQTFPGAYGTVAALNGDTAQVQNTTTQTAVTWTSSTTFTAQQSATASALAVGDCVVARPASTGSPSSGSSGSPSASVAAATIEIMPATNGACSMGGGFPGGGGFRTTNPVAPSHGTGAAARPGGFGAVGMIKSLGDGTMAVAVTPRAVGGASAPATSTRTVTWTAATTFTQVVPATSSAVAVGVCVVAQGATDTTGALTAKSIAVSQPVNGTCSAGFGGRRGGYGQGGTGSNG